MKKHSYRDFSATLAARGSILVFCIMAFEIAIMISPFAFFFYSVFNPIFKFLDRFAATAWLTAFYLPHMILPPTRFLTALRIVGSGLFIAGLFTFVVCALQVYLGKVFKWGIAGRGLYSVVRHPQYLALAAWGAGMCILWPRFTVLAGFSCMLALYYFLARDEERRMTAKFGDGYKAYMTRTGMFLPRFASGRLERLLPKALSHGVAVPVLTIAVVMAAGFALREVTLRSLPLASLGNLTVVSILPEDNALTQTVLGGIAKAEAGDEPGPLKPGSDYLAYLMPADYIMQGMIADTGSDSHLFKQHHTVAMIAEWVLHPFSHLRASPAMHMAKMHGVSPEFARRHHCPIGMDDPAMQCDTCPYRRVILVQVDRPEAGRFSGRDLLSFDATRTPVCYLDMNAQTGEIVNVKAVEKGTAWRDVPTPAI